MKFSEIYRPAALGDPVPEKYSIVCIPLDGRLQSSLQWQSAREAADAYIQQEVKILWDLQLGLFDELPLPLNQQGQFLSLSLAVEHFCKEIGQPYQDQSAGVILYRGALDFTGSLDASQYLNEQQLSPLIFCADICFGYLQLLGNNIPAYLPKYYIVDALPDKLETARLLASERLAKVHVITLPEDPMKHAQVGVCLPTVSLQDDNHFQEALISLQTKAIPYRLIPEADLHTEWEGLDALLVLSEAVSIQGRRQLQGFMAAGGTIITIGAPLGLPQEVSIHEYLSS